MFFLTHAVYSCTSSQGEQMKSTENSCSYWLHLNQHLGLYMSVIYVLCLFLFKHFVLNQDLVISVAKAKETAGGKTK